MVQLQSLEEIEIPALARSADRGERKFNGNQLRRKIGVCVW